MPRIAGMGEQAHIAHNIFLLHFMFYSCPHIQRSVPFEGFVLLGILIERLLTFATTHERY